MKTLSQFITDNTSDIRESLQFALEAKGDIKLPYTFDIYNKGAKNVDYKLTKANIYKIYHAIPGYHDPSIELPVAAHKLRYSEFPTKESTKNWTEIPKIYEKFAQLDLGNVKEIQEFEYTLLHLAENAKGWTEDETEVVL